MVIVGNNNERVGDVLIKNILSVPSLDGTGAYYKDGKCSQ